MKPILYSMAAAAISLVMSGAFADEGGPRFGPQAEAQPQLGESAPFEVPPSPAPLPDNVPQQSAPTQPRIGTPLPPAPGSTESDNNSAPVVGPTTNTDRQNDAIAGIVKARELINQGRYEDAIRQASRSIALDPANSAELKRIRAEAYLKQGRFEEALADASPLEVTVTSPRAELKTKQTVLGVVTAGTRLTIDDVNGNWLKVVTAGDQHYDWAWIRRRDVSPGAPQSAVVQRVPQKLEYNIPSYAPMPVTPAPGVYIYGPGGPYYNYGRAYYDYWQHVPPQYWQFLP